MDDGLVLETDYGANYLDAKVLILIVVDNGLVRFGRRHRVSCQLVLILIVVDNGIVPEGT